MIEKFGKQLEEVVFQSFFLYKLFRNHIKLHPIVSFLHILILANFLPLFSIGVSNLNNVIVKNRISLLLLKNIIPNLNFIFLSISAGFGVPVN